MRKIFLAVIILTFFTACDTWHRNYNVVINSGFKVTHCLFDTTASDADQLTQYDSEKNLFYVSVSKAKIERTIVLKGVELSRQEVVNTNKDTLIK